MIDEVRGRADAGDRDAQRELPGLLITHGLFDELRARADGGDPSSVRLWTKLVELLDRRRPAVATPRLRARGDRNTTEELVSVLIAAGEIEAATDFARAGARPGFANHRIRELLASLLAKQGLEDELRHRLADGDEEARNGLITLLFTQRRVDDLRAVEGELARIRFVNLLGVLERVDDLRALAATGDSRAHNELVNLHLRLGQEAELAALADAGDRYAAAKLADLLETRGDEQALRDRADAGDATAARKLDHLLHTQGRHEELRARAEAGDTYAASFPTATFPDDDTLRTRAKAGDLAALHRWMDRLVERGDIDQFRDLDHDHARQRFGHLLSALGREDELRARAEADIPFAVDAWTAHLAKAGRDDELREFVDRTGRGRWRLAEVLLKQGLFTELADRARQGDRHAGMKLRYHLDPPFDDNPENRIRPSG